MRNRERPAEALLGTLAMIGTISLWGFVPAATRSLIDDMNSGQILLARFGFGALFALLLIGLVRPAMPARSMMLKTIILGIFGMLGFNVPLVIGIHYVEAGVAALLLGTQPVIIAVLAALVLREYISPRMWAGLAIALLGSSLIALTGGGDEINISPSYLVGCGLVFLAAFLYGLYSIIVKPYLGPDIPPASIALLGAIFSLPFVLPFGASGFATALGNLDASGWLAVALISCGATIGAGVLFSIGLMYLPASRAGTFLYLVPVVGVISSVILLGEHLHTVTIAGGLCIIGGVVLATFSPPAQPEVARAKPAAN